MTFGLDVNYVDKTYSTKANGYWKNLDVHLFKSLKPVSPNHYMRFYPLTKSLHTDSLAKNGDSSSFLNKIKNELKDLYKKKKSHKNLSIYQEHIWTMM